MLPKKEKKTLPVSTTTLDTSLVVAQGIV